MTYKFKFVEELGWAALVAAVVFAGTQLIAFDPAGITDWKAWALALAAGVARAAVAGAIAKLSGGEG